MTDTTLPAFLASGTKAARVAFTPSPPTPASGPNPGYLWHETDTTNTYAWNSVSAGWDIVGAFAPVIVANLPGSPVKGWRAFVTDATATLTAGIGTIVAGSGANSVPVVYDGANWRVG